MKKLVDPNRFIISRKRKKYRFALFYNYPNCFELEEWKPLPVKGLVVEVGAGTGIFLVELATRYPYKKFIAVDVKADRLQKGARMAAERGLKNIYFVRARADQLLEVVKPGSVDELWLTFSDPFPKKGDAKRRLTHHNYLEIYKKAHVGKNAKLYLKTDSHSLFDWSLEQLVTANFPICELSYDLHASNLSSDYKIMTTYEQKWTAQGLPIYFVSANF